MKKIYDSVYCKTNNVELLNTFCDPENELYPDNEIDDFERYSFTGDSGVDQNEKADFDQVSNLLSTSNMSTTNRGLLTSSNVNEKTLLKSFSANCNTEFLGHKVII